MCFRLIFPDTANDSELPNSDSDSESPPFPLSFEFHNSPVRSPSLSMTASSEDSRAQSSTTVPYSAYYGSEALGSTKTTTTTTTAATALGIVWSNNELTFENIL